MARSNWAVQGRGPRGGGGVGGRPGLCAESGELVEALGRRVGGYAQSGSLQTYSTRRTWATVDFVGESRHCPLMYADGGRNLRRRAVHTCAFEMLWMVAPWPLFDRGQSAA